MLRTVPRGCRAPPPSKPASPRAPPSAHALRLSCLVKPAEIAWNSVQTQQTQAGRRMEWDGMDGIRNQHMDAVHLHSTYIPRVPSWYGKLSHMHMQANPADGQPAAARLGSGLVGSCVSYGLVVGAVWLCWGTYPTTPPSPPQSGSSKEGGGLHGRSAWLGAGLGWRVG